MPAQTKPDSTLTTFGGLVTELNPADLPAGSSPLCCDCDFTIGSVKTRLGLENVYVYAGSSETASAVALQNAGSGVPWTPPMSGTPSTNSQAATGGGFVTSSTLTVISNAAGGILVGDIGIAITLVRQKTGADPIPTVSSLTDSLGNTWIPLNAVIQYTDPPNTGTLTYSFQVWYAVMATPVPQTNTFTVTAAYGGVSSFPPKLSFTNFTGVTTLDQAQRYAYASVTTMPFGPMTTTFNEVLMAFGSPVVVGTGPINFFEFDPANQPVGSLTSGDYYNIAGIIAPPGTYSGTWPTSAGPTGGGVVLAGFKVAASPGFTVTLTSGQTSQLLDATGFGFTVPATSSILGIQVVVNGNQTVAGVPITVTALGGGQKTFSLPTSTGTVTLGGPNDLWGATWTPAQLNNPGFGFSFQATNQSPPVTFTLLPPMVTVTVWYTPPNNVDFNYIKTFENVDGDTLTLALDEAGNLWQENVVATPGTLAQFYSGISPNSFAKSETYDDREFIAFSDLLMGTDMPRQYNGQWLDRISQVGPGAPPSVTFTSTSYTILASPNGVTQPSAKVLGNGNPPLSGGYEIVWSSGPGIASPGNVISFYFHHGVNLPALGFKVGGVVVIAGVQTINGQNPNGTYIITQVGTAPGFNSSGIFQIFSVQATTNTFANQAIQAGATYQFSLATVTTTVPVPNVQVGSQITLSGVGVASWNNTWTVIETPNAAQLNITSTSLSAGIATYDFTLISGSAPTVGEQVTVTGCTNGPQVNGTDVFNIVNGVITAVGAGSFSVSINAADVPAGPETNAQGIINGTIFQFDPGFGLVGSMTSPIFGNSGGGTIVVAGGLTAGVRQCVVMFLTRNGYLTAPSPPVTFTLNANANSLVVSNIPIGPPNVIARVLAFTGSNGAFFYWIPVPVTVVSNGQNVTYSATIVQDNSSREVTLNFVDAVLLNASPINFQGSNNFAQIELGSSTGIIPFASRIFAWGEQNKVQNFINLSFDGGYLGAAPSGVFEPLGWTVDATSGAGGQLIVSQLFGNSYYIKNTTGSTQAAYGMITQTAFQDYNKVAILSPQTFYNVRVTARCPSLIGTGNLVIDLFSPSFGAAFGTATFPLSSMTGTMKIFSGTLLITVFQTQVPQDLLLRVWAQNLPDGGDVEIDRLEVFDPEQPVLSTQLRGSYFDNFEAFDGVTGNLGVAVQNQQPVKTCFTLFDNLYIVRSRSLCSTTDNGITEPLGWTIREIAGIGTPSINGVDYSGDRDTESWALIASQAGLYLFDGGQPQKISPEIDTLWQTINWTYGYTLWVKNDIINRKILIGVPIATPNQWMPNFPVNQNPTQPNVILMLSYRELMTSGAVEYEGSVRQSYMGELRTFQLGRKWSAWSIQAAYADFIKRPDTTQPLFFCADTDNGKIYQQITGNYLDDGTAIPWQYLTSPMPKTQEAQALGMGSHMMEANFLTVLLQGNGECGLTIYPDTIASPFAENLGTVTMGNPPSWGDSEIPLNAAGARFFIGFENGSLGSNFELSRSVMTILEHPFAPLRGSN